jgi:hypothetical protein
LEKGNQRKANKQSNGYCDVIEVPIFDLGSNHERTKESESGG